ncbi:MAG: hypothetical protein ABJD13_06150 [Paracoccaceae bacterium]
MIDAKVTASSWWGQQLSIASYWTKQRIRIALLDVIPDVHHTQSDWFANSFYFQRFGDDKANTFKVFQKPYSSTTSS